MNMINDKVNGGQKLTKYMPQISNIIAFAFALLWGTPEPGFKHTFAHLCHWLLDPAIAYRTALR